MRYLTKWSVFMLFSILLSGGCRKFLDKKQNAKLVVPEALSDLQALLDNDGVMNNSWSPSFGETSADDYFLPDANYNSRKENYQYWYTWRYYFDPSSPNDWAKGYTPVYYTNLVLDQLKNLDRTASNLQAWDNVKGSALLYRSYYFLALLWNYSKAYDSATANEDLGIALRLTSDFNVKSTRATNQQCYEQVIKDTKQSIPLLPNLPQIVTRPSKSAAYGLLARCYLSMGDYKDALLYSDSCITLLHKLMDYNGDDQINQNVGFTDPFSDYNKENILYMQMNNNYTIFRTSLGYGRIDTALYRSYDDNDLRKTMFFKNYGDGYQIFYGTYTTIQSYYFSGLATDEMYLIRAECFVRNGDIESGLDDLNTLLLKRYKTGTFTPYHGLEQKDALALVLNERRKELVMRGLRWIDIKRLNKEGRNIILRRKVNGTEYTLSPNANYYALPLPEDIIQLTGMLQNPS